MTHIVSCDLECSNGGYCALVAGTEQEIGKMAQSGQLIEVCVCRPGFTGLTCESINEECVLPDRICHNKVPCIRRPDTGDWGCDCSVADSISEFAGRMCRKPITEYCPGKFDPDSAFSFCTNGGYVCTDVSVCFNGKHDFVRNICRNIDDSLLVHFFLQTMFDRFSCYQS